MMEDNPTVNLGLLEHNNAAIPITNIDNLSQLDLVDISNDKVVERCKKKFKCDSNKIMQKQTSNKKSKSLTGCLRQLVDNSSVKETLQFEVLCEIRNHLKNVKLYEARQFKLEKLKLKTEYPNHIFVISSDSE